METPIIHDEVHQRFILPINDTQNAFVDYQVREDVLYLVYSEVPPSLQGQGIGKILADKTYQYLAENDLKAVPVCGYLHLIAARNPEWKAKFL